MAKRSEAIVFKVLSGSQFGVEVELEDGTYSFGSGPDADIILSDVSLAEAHGAIKISGSRIEIKSLGGEVGTSSGLTLGGGDSDWHEIAHLDVISAGTTRFAVGSATASWANLMSVAGRGDAAIEAAGRKRKSSGVGVAFAGIALVAVLSAGAIFLTSSDAGLATLANTQPIAPIDSLRSALSEMDFVENLTIEEAVDGSIDVAGYVQSAVERRAVQNAIADTNAFVRRRIWVRDSMEVEVSALLESQDVAVTYSLLPNGILKLEGTILDQEAAKGVVSLLESQVFGLAGIQDDIRSADDFLNEADDLLGKVGLDGLVILRLDGALIEATGVVPEEKTDGWIGFIKVYAKKFAQTIPLRSFVALEAVQGSGLEPVLILDGAPETAELFSGRVLPASVLRGESPLTAEQIAGLATPPIENAIAPLPVEPGVPASADPGVVSGGAPEDTGAVDLGELVALLRDRDPELFDRLALDLQAGIVPEPDLFGQIVTALNGAATPADLRRLLQGQSQEDLLAELRVLVAAELAKPDQAATDNSPGDAGLDAVAVGARPILGAAAGRSLSASVLSGDISFSPPASAIPISGDTPDLEPEEISIQDLVDAGVGGSASIEGVGLAAPSQPSEPASIPALPVEVTSVGALALTSFPTDFQIDEGLDLMIGGAQSLLDNGDSASLEVFQNLASGPGKLLFELVRLQQKKLQNSETYLVAPRPISAVPVQRATRNLCWDGASISVERLPAVLLWMDILSVDVRFDLTEIEPDLRRMFMEAALSPQRIRKCLEAMEGEYPRLLLSSSAFLNEASRNENFVRFLFRSVPDFPLDIDGLNLSGERFLQLGSGEKLREGAAPNLQSRISLIGDLGVLIRVADGYEARLYDENVAWYVLEE